MCNTSILRSHHYTMFAKILYFSSTILDKHIIPVIIVFAIMGTSAVFINILLFERKLRETMVLESAESLSKTLTTFRTLYTSEVVGSAEEAGVEVTHDYKEKEHAIPLPATLSMLIGNKISEHLDGGETRLYSPYPFPWRKEEGGMRDDFEKEAWEKLTQNPDQPYYRFEERDGRKFIRYTISDVMRPQCINCHNTHPDTPKNDWKVGDVRGVLEIIKPLDRAAIVTRSNMNQTFLLLFGLTIFSIVVFYFIVVSLRARGEKAEKANQAKTDFLANMSHELRTPLNSILGLTRMFVEDPKMSTDNKEMAGIVYKSATNLLESVNDILDISKVESGGIVLENIGFNVKNMMTNIMESMSPIASARGVSLNHHYKSTNIPDLRGDPFRINRILINLISNAIKYTDKGTVNVIISVKSITENQVEVYFSITDTGIGIPEDKLDSIFDKFTQANVSTTRKYGGTGLGLAITKELVEIMGGEIGVESEIGRGSHFWFKIPLEITDKIEEEETDKRRIERRRRNRNEDRTRIPVQDVRILVAEDHLLNQDLMSRLLKHMGVKHYDIVENGLLAVEAFERDDYDLILMDCHMPEKNGYQATQDIRNSQKDTHKDIPIIALTADAMVGTREKCLKAGMSEYLSKPIDSDEFKHILEEWVLFSKEGENKHQKNKDEEEMNSSIDMTLLEGYADTPEDIQQFVDVFLKQSDESIKLMEDHCVDGECREWVEAAHKFKGGSGMIGAKKLHSLCEQAQGMDDVSSKERNEKFEEIKKEYEIVKNELNNSTF